MSQDPELTKFVPTKTPQVSSPRFTQTATSFGNSRQQRKGLDPTKEQCNRPGPGRYEYVTGPFTEAERGNFEMKRKRVLCY